MKTPYTLCAFADEAAADRAGQIKALKENGIPYLEIRGVDGVNIAQLSIENARRFRAELDAAGLTVWSIGSPAGKSPITQDFSMEERQFEHLLSMADIFGASCIRLFSFFGTGGEEKWFPEVVRRLERFVSMAQGSGVTLCHENEKGIYGDTADRCAEIHEALPQLRAVFDPANFVQCGQDVVEAWQKLSPYVFYGHIKDCLPDGRVVPPGDGVGALASYLPDFFAQGGEVLTLEPHLADFVGLSALESEDHQSVVGQSIQFESHRAAFDFATHQFKKLLEETLGYI